MKRVLIIHRDYRYRGGEEAFLDDTLIPHLSRQNIPFKVLRLPPLSFWSFFELVAMVLGLEKLRPSYRQGVRLGRKESFSHVIFNNFVPTISLALPRFFKDQGVKTIFWMHNARISCANGLLFNGQKDCHRCLTRSSHWAFLQNCQKNLLQSFLYSWVYRANRVPRLLHASIDLFACNSEFTMRILADTYKFLGLPTKDALVIPMPPARLSSQSQLISSALKNIPQPFYLFMGRISHEKGADLFADLALRFPHRGFVLCGTGPLFEELKQRQIPNLVFLGHVHNEKPWLYANAAALIIPSRVKETSSLIIAESQPYGTPIVYPPGGGAEESFKRLKRSGCFLNEFKGQEFQRTNANEDQMIFYQQEFKAQFDSALHTM